MWLREAVSPSNPIYKPDKLILATGSNISKVPYTVLGLLSPEGGCWRRKGGGGGVVEA
jgi:hypothetical protein